MLGAHVGGPKRGPMCTARPAGGVRCIVLIDDYTRYKWVYPTETPQQLYRNVTLEVSMEGARRSQEYFRCQNLLLFGKKFGE